MNFSVIITVDVPSDTKISYYLPSRAIRRKLETTEGDEQYDWEYLGGVWAKGKHRKLGGILNRKDFDRLVEEMGLYAQDVETLGSLGAPGFGPYLVPAVSFNSDERDAIISMYATPIPNVPAPKTAEGQWRAWLRMRKAIINTYSVEGRYGANTRIRGQA